MAQAIIGDFIMSKNVPAGVWVKTCGWHPPSQLVERRYLTRQEIDAVAPNHPVFTRFLPLYRWATLGGFRSPMFRAPKSMWCGRPSFKAVKSRSKRGFKSLPSHA